MFKDLLNRIVNDFFDIINKSINRINFDIRKYIDANTLSQKSIAVATFACCGFANFSTMAIQIGGIGELAPSQRKNLARLGLKALICGTLVSYISAAIAGIIL